MPETPWKPLTTEVLRAWASTNLPEGLVVVLCGYDTYTITGLAQYDGFIEIFLNENHYDGDDPVPASHYTILPHPESP